MLFSCGTVKKEWVKENFTSKEDLQSIQDNLTYSNEEVKKEIKESLIYDLTEKFKESSNKSSESENETTTIKGSITAEDGKEKSATVGNTTIKSNGANVTFETTNTKAMTKEFESKYNELNKKLDQEQNYSEYLHTEINSLKSEIANLRSSYESEKTAKTKEVVKSGFSFGFIIIGVFVIIIGLVILYFRKTVLGWFKTM